MLFTSYLLLFTKLLCWYVVATYGLNVNSKFQCHKSTGCLVTYIKLVLHHNVWPEATFNIKTESKGLQTVWFDLARLTMVIYLYAKFHSLILSGW